MNNQDTVDQVDAHTPQSSARILIICFFIALAGLVWVTTSTTPGAGGPLAVLSFLFFVFLCTALFVALVLRVAVPRIIHRKLSSVRLLYTAVSIGAGVVFLVGLQTLRQLTVIDIVLVTIFEALLNFYLLRRF